MPWKETSTMSLRLEFVQLATQEGANIRLLCRRFGVSAKTAYKWLHRYQHGGREALDNHSRRPKHSPKRTSFEMEQKVIELRTAHSAWGGRKLHARLLALGYTDVPSVSTVSAILNRYGLIDPLEASKHQAWQRFEAQAPNILWQMDFKGHFQMLNGRCHPLTVLDDCSRYNLGLYACADETIPTVQEHLTTIFRRYGLPGRILVDNGSPWESHTSLTVWLIRLAVGISHSSPSHPQTLGKDERFHRTLKAEVINGQSLHSLQHCQKAFDSWRIVYNYDRPHEALGMATPASRYRPSSLQFPETLPPIEYSPGDLVRKVQGKGEIYFKNRVFTISRAFRGYPVALRPTLTDGAFDVFFCSQKIDRINLNRL